MKVLLIDDHELVRFAVRNLLTESVPGIEVVEASSLRKGMVVYAGQRDAIELVILDLNLPDSRGLAGLRRFGQSHPGAPIVVLSGSVDDSIAAEATSLGAMAFLHKTSEVDDLRCKLVDLLSKVPAVRSGNAGTPGRRTRTHDGRELSLKEQDLQVLDFVLQGSTNQEIADALGIAVGTTKNRISGLLAAFGVTSRARLIALFK